jgi:NAD(P)-dependent dehydrogenase (short-subunit alcohol dehydrogenase family)
MTLRERFEMPDRVAVVTGSGQGIGRAIAWGLAEFGCDVVVNARRVSDLEVTARGVEERGRRALVVPGDVRDLSDAIATHTMAAFGRLDIWVNNVGGSDEKTTRPLADTPDHVFRSQLELNLTTAFQGARAAAAHLPYGGVIINITSGAGTRGSPMTGPYAAAKAGLINLTQTLALELAERGIRVNAVSPGPVVTEAYLEILGVENELDALARTIPLGRTGTPDDIAAAVVYLASPAASWVTGEHLLVAGGRTQRSYQYKPRSELIAQPGGTKKAPERSGGPE